MAVRMVPVGFVRRALDASQRHGTDLRPALVAAGITDRELGDPDTRLTIDQVSRFMLTACDITDDELMGLGLTAVPRGTFSLLSFAIIHCPDLGSVLHRFTGFLPALPSSAPIRIDYGDERVRIWFDTTMLPAGGGAEESDAPGASGLRSDAPGLRADASLVSDFGLLLIHRFSAWLTGRRLEPAAVELPYTSPAPVDVVAYHHMFGIPVSFGRPFPALEFAAEDLPSPVVQTEDTLRAFLRDSPAQLLSTRDYDTGLAARVRRLVEMGTRGGQPSSAEIAEALAVSEPQLRRLLRSEGTTLGALRETVMRQAAVTALEAGEPVETISRRLGFSEPSAFRRAFKRWTGKAPGEYR